MTRIMEIARKHKLLVLEDAAQSFGARWFAPGVTDEAAAQFTGSIGDMAAFSFYPTKNLGAYGDAGLITTNNDDLALVARKLRTHGSIEPYRHEMLGYNSRMDEIQAAILRVKLPHLPSGNDFRRRLASNYQTALAGLQNITWPAPSPGHIFHQITVRIAEGRDKFQQQLRSLGVASNVYYPLLAHQLFPSSLKPISVPIAEVAAQQVVSLPIVASNGNESSLEYVFAAIRKAAASIRTE